MYIISEGRFIFIFDFMNFLLHAFILFMIESQIFDFGMKDSNHGILLIKTGCKIFRGDGEFLSTGISEKTHFLRIEIGIYYMQFENICFINPNLSYRFLN